MGDMYSFISLLKIDAAMKLNLINNFLNTKYLTIFYHTYLHQANRRLWIIVIIIYILNSHFRYIL